MGMLSTMIHVCPAELKVDLRKFDDKTLFQLNFRENIEFDSNDPESYIITLAELEDLSYDTRLYGYLVVSKLLAWEKFLVEIGAQNPEAKFVDFHFTYEDGNVPFFFRMDNEDKEVSLYNGKFRHAAYFDKVNNDEYEEGFSYDFNMTKYLSTYQELLESNHFKVQSFKDMIAGSHW